MTDDLTRRTFTAAQDLPPRPPTEAELLAFFDLQLRQMLGEDQVGTASQEDRDQITGDIENARIAVFDHYISDGPGYTGSLMVVVWSGGPETQELYGWDPMGFLHRIPSDREMQARPTLQVPALSIPDAMAALGFEWEDLAGGCSGYTKRVTHPFVTYITKRDNSLAPDLFSEPVDVGTYSDETGDIVGPVVRFPTLVAAIDALTPPAAPAPLPPAPEYRVWITLEQFQDGGDPEYLDLDLGFAATGIFPSEEQGREYAVALHQAGQVLADHFQRDWRAK